MDMSHGKDYKYEMVLVEEIGVTGEETNMRKCSLIGSRAFES